MAQPRQPNIVLITWHDTGRWFGCYGYRELTTPNVDRLAAEGCRFSNFFAQCAICSPSRAAILTGRFPQANGVMYLANGPGDNRIHPHVPHLAAWLQDRGYHTALAGVQHESCVEHLPLIQRFHEAVAHHPWPAAPAVAEGACRVIAQRARQSDRPFYLQVGFFEAHRPFDFHNCPPDDRRGVHVPGYLAGTRGQRAEIAGMQGMIRRGDEAIGRILDALDRTELSDDTLVIMTADHGVHLPRAKTQMYDAGLEVPLIVRRPGVIGPGRTVDALASHVDLLPTMLDLAGLASPEPSDGLSFADHVRGETDEPIRREHFAHMVETFRCIRTDRHKLIRNFNPPNDWTLPVGDPDRSAAPPTDAQRLAEPRRYPFVELYDLADDPLERRNLAFDPASAELREALDRRLLRFLADQRDSVLNRRPTGAWAAAAVADARDSLGRLQ